MKLIFTKRLFLWLFIAGTAVLIFFFNAGQVQFAQTGDASPGEERKIEEEAETLGKIWTEQSARKSLELFQKAARQWENKKNYSAAARCRRETVKLQMMLAEEVAPLPILEKSLLLERKDKNLEGEAETLSHLTIVSLKLGDNRKAKTYLDQALSLAKETGNPRLLARAIFASGSYLYNQRDFPAMLAEYEKALPLFREAGDRTGEAETLIELAYSYIINNERTRGRDAARNALEVASGIGDRRHQAFALIVLGDAFQRMGEWEAALKSFLEAESIFPENLDFFEKAILYNRLAAYNLAYNELNQAKKYFQKSFALFDRIGNSEGRSELLTELGQISVREGDFDEAMRYFNQSKEIAVKARDPMTLAILELKIGDTHFARGDTAEAEKSYLKALSHYEKIGIKYRLAEVHEKLGLIYEEQKNYAAAREKYLLALALNQRVLSKFAEAQSFYHLARLDLLENRHDAALERIKESIRLTESSQQETANSQLKRSFIANVFERYELYINLLMKLAEQNPRSGFAVEALQAAEKSKARVMQENLLISQANFVKDADAETVRREKEIRISLNARADELTDLLSRNSGDQNEIAKISREIGDLEIELEEIKAKLKQNSPLYSAIKNPPPFDVAEFQRSILDDESLLLEFYLGKKESYLWLVGKNEFQSFVLPPRAQIEARVDYLRALLREREMKADESIENYQARIKTADENFRIEASLLSQELFGQISEKLSTKRLIVVPDGKLHYFPVAALPLPNAADEPILLTNEIINEPSAQTLVLLTKSKNQAAPAEKDLLVFSDPVFSRDDARLDTPDKTQEKEETAASKKLRFAESLNSLSRLVASKDETDSILEIVGSSNSDVFSGFAANRERLLGIRASDYKIIHFATHGLVNEERPELSGIVLSRFDEAGRKLDESFRLHDIYGLNLNADLVVLSACETGVGKEVKGEGLLSLNNAFLQTGAKTVVASLWKVEDRATLELMKNFYAAMKEQNLTPAQALREAQIKLRRLPQYRSPFYWAAFTAQGDFASRPQISGDSSKWIYALLLLPLALPGIYWLRRSKLFNR